MKVTKRKSFALVTSSDGDSEAHRLARKQVTLRSGRVLRGQAADTLLEMRDRMIGDIDRPVRRPDWLQ